MPRGTTSHAVSPRKTRCNICGDSPVEQVRQCRQGINSSLLRAHALLDRAKLLHHGHVHGSKHAAATHHQSAHCDALRPALLARCALLLWVELESVLGVSPH